MAKVRLRAGSWSDPEPMLISVAALLFSLDFVARRSSYLVSSSLVSPRRESTPATKLDLLLG